MSTDPTDPLSRQTLKRWEIANFDTLKKACLNGHLCLCQMYRKNGKRELVVCAVSVEGEQRLFVPLALMFTADDGNPYELFNDDPFKKPGKL